MLRGKIRSGKITGPVQNYPALSMVFGAFEVFKSTESEADPFKYNPTAVQASGLKYLLNASTPRIASGR